MKSRVYFKLKVYFLLLVYLKVFCMDKQKLKHNLILISFGIILYVVLLNISRVIDSINYILHIISPMIYGLVIAYVLNIPYTWLKEKVLVKLQDRWGCQPQPYLS